MTFQMYHGIFKYPGVRCKYIIHQYGNHLVPQYQSTTVIPFDDHNTTVKLCCLLRYHKIMMAEKKM